MEYIRQIINSEQLPPIFNIPNAMKNKRVEVIILPLEDEKTTVKKSLRGALKAYANSDLQHLEDAAWSDEVKEKYETL